MSAKGWPEKIYMYLFINMGGYIYERKRLAGKNIFIIFEYEWIYKYGPDSAGKNIYVFIYKYGRIYICAQNTGRKKLYIYNL